MKKMLVTLAFLNTLFFMSTACSQDDSNYIQPKFEDLGAYTPDDISNWPHAIFSFNDWACTDRQMADNRLGIDPIVRNGSRTTVLAYSSKENIRFTTLRSGENPYDYILQIKDFDADIPQVWIQCSSLDQMAGPITLTPLTSTLKIRLIEAPDNMESLQIVLPGMNDALYLFSGVTEPADGIKNKTLRLTASDGDRTYYLFPMCSDRSWNLDFTISIDGSQYPGTLTISEQARHSKWISIFQKWIPEVTTSLIAKRNTVQNQPCWLRIPSKMPGTTKLSRTRTLTTTFTCSRVRHGNRSRYTTRSVPTLRVCTNRYGTTGTMPRNFVTRCAMPNS